MELTASLDLAAIDVMDLLPVLLAFLLGFGAKLIGLPPLVGFLVAGFLLGAFGMQSSDALQKIADLGVTLLLFTIGLKLNVKQLLSPAVWATATVHMGIVVLAAAGLVLLLSGTGMSLFAGIDLQFALLIGFALSFSSTVFAVKVLEVEGEMGSLHGLFAKFRLRARSATLASLSLANFSEFGLIVVALGVSSGWMSGDWLTVIAIALSISFVLASPLNTLGKSIYRHWHDGLVRYERSKRLPEDEVIDPGDDFWFRASHKNSSVRFALLTFPDHSANLAVADLLREFSVDVHTASIAKFDDQIDELKAAGVNEVFNLYAEAGTGFAEHVWERLEHRAGG